MHSETRSRIFATSFLEITSDVSAMSTSFRQRGYLPGRPAPGPAFFQSFGSNPIQRFHRSGREALEHDEDHLSNLSTPRASVVSLSNGHGVEHSY